MKKKIFYLFLLLFTLSGVIRAQDKGFTILLGPSVNYYYGDTKQKITYASENLSFQVNGQLGYISTRGGTNRGNMLGIFASAGNSSPEMLAIMQTNGATINGTLNRDKKFNEFYNLEGGMVIARFLRLSGGIGRQTYTYNSNHNGVLNYYTGTVGFVFNMDVVNWVIDAQLMTGKDLDKSAIRFSTGFMVKF
jgi:hypothetical protein